MASVFRPVIFDKLPSHDTCWSITTGKDGLIYIGVCGEHIGGLSVFIASYDPQTEKVEYLCEVAPLLGEPPDNGRATHSKIHYCLLPGDDGLLYGATHCTGAPLGDPIWRPWNAWNDPIRQFSGFHFFIYDPATRKLEDLGIGSPNEGSRAMALDPHRRLLYGVTYPRDHFYVYSLDERKYHDLGRIGDTNPQAVFVDSEFNAYTTDDYGYLIRCRAGTLELERLDLQIPHGPMRNGWHNTLYDVEVSPDGCSFYGGGYGYDMRVYRFEPAGHSTSSGQAGRITDFGRAWGDDDGDWRNLEHNSHIGGMVFGEDGMLYYACSVAEQDGPRLHLIKMHPETGERQDIGLITDGEKKSGYIAKATRDWFGNLYFAESGLVPPRIWIYRPEGDWKPKPRWPLVRYWG